MKRRPPLIVAMEVLSMNVSELSAALRQMATEIPELTLEPYDGALFTSDDFDVAVPTRSAVQVAAPDCGNPVITRQHDKTSARLEECQSFIDSLQPRREMLTKLTDTLLAELPDFPSEDSHLHISTLAELCDVHVTTVARTIQGKLCHTSSGPVAFSQFVTNLRT